jgi:outer membrane autotransporter protein
MAGLAFQRPFDSSKLLLAGFIEAGVGKYKINGNYSATRPQGSINNSSLIGFDPTLDQGVLMSDYGDEVVEQVTARGEIRTASIGLIARQRWNNGLRVEAAGRVGIAHNDFRTNAFDTIMGESVRYKYNAPFLAAHVGLGYEWQINDHSSLDLIGRYFWTHQEGKSVTFDTNEVVQFEDLTSHKVRAGARYSRDHNARMSYYFGAYWEHEFDAQAKGSFSGFAFDSSDFKGDTGIGEVGIIFHSTEDRRWNVECGFQGYMGQNRGFSGGVRVGYQF